MVAFPSLSLASGAIKGWDRRNAHYFELLESLARHYRFDLEQPFEDLPAPVRQVLLYGSGEEGIRFTYATEAGQGGGRKVSKKHPFEGIVPNFERRWQQTDSPIVREDLARYRSTQPCPDCQGTRLRREARHVYLVNPHDGSRKAIYDIGHATLRESHHYFESLQMQGAKAEIASKVVREIGLRLKFLNDVGLNYLSLERSAETLSGGESQRIRLASQIGSGLTGVMYVLDEPSIGLHQRDNDRLIATLKHLRDIGNSVLVVEHDEDMIRAADHVIDLGPGAGVHGGRVIAERQRKGQGTEGGERRLGQGQGGERGAHRSSSSRLAGFSRMALSAVTKGAATAPSMTRWSKEGDMYIILRATICPL